MEKTMELFSDAVNEIANGPKITSYQDLTESLMRRLAEKGMTLEQASGPKIMNRSLRTLKQHCRDFGISFPDYEPRAMKKQREESDG